MDDQPTQMDVESTEHVFVVYTCYPYEGQHLMRIFKNYDSAVAYSESEAGPGWTRVQPNVWRRDGITQTEIQIEKHQVEFEKFHILNLSSSTDK